MNEINEDEEILSVGAPLLNHSWDGILVNGSEEAAELRKLAVATIDRCPMGRVHLRCPFQMLGGLSYVSRTYLLEKMDRNALFQLFAMEQACRIEAERRPLDESVFPGDS